jgi:hypothetical protein
MVFNLNTHASFPCKDPSIALRCYKESSVGFGNGELCAYNEPFNTENAFISWTNFSGYNIPSNNEGINMLINQKNNNHSTVGISQ